MLRKHKVVIGRSSLPVAGLAAVSLAVAVWIACGGDGQLSFQVTVEPGRVACEPLTQLRSYRYKTEVALDLAERPPEMPPEDPDRGPAPFQFTWAIEAAVQEGDKLQATLSYPGQNQPDLPVTVIDNQAWYLVGERWEIQSLGAGTPFPVPYLPLDTCNAIAPDIDTSQLTGEPDTVGGLPSRRYHFDSLQSELPDRHPSLGPESDAARVVNDFQGDIWIAETGSFITKLDLTGTGTYENGRQLNLEVFLELSDINDEGIKIEPPI